MTKTLLTIKIASSWPKFMGKQSIFPKPDTALLSLLNSFPPSIQLLWKKKMLKVFMKASPF